MSFIDTHFSKKEKRTVIFAVTIGNLLEWYEIYLYVYWAPIIAKLFFNSGSDATNLMHTFLVFAVGFLARPLGGLFFGRLGDLIGRRKSLILSILMMIVPTFVTGFLPTYQQIGLYAPVILTLMRILQSFPAGGELPGAACYLYESAPPASRRYLASWTSWGYQLGILISTLECFFLDKYLSPEDLVNWGWRLSFIVGGLFGFLGLALRYKLHETPLYREMATHERVVKEPIGKVLWKHRRAMVKGILYCTLNSSAFYLLTVNFPLYAGQLLGTTYKSDLAITIALIVLITLPLPFFGKLGDRYDNRKLLSGATVGILALLYPLYLAINGSSILFMLMTMVPFALLFTCLSALVPYVLADLFPTHDRFTCAAVSFNIADAILGGFTPTLVLCLLNFTQDKGSFVWILLFGALLSLSSYLTIKHRKA